MNKINRLLFGGVIGLMAGFSFHLAVLPFIAENILPGALDDIYASMNPATFWLVAVWALAGAAAGWCGGMRAGGLRFGLGGLLGGLLFGVQMIAAGSTWPALLVTAVAGGVYGWGAGLLVGGGFGPVVER